MRYCKKCNTTENLASRGNICRKCKAIVDKKYVKTKLENQAKKRAENPLIFLPPIVGPCGIEFDEEVCPKRRKLARKRADMKRPVEILACLSCEIVAPEHQPIPQKACKRCGSPELKLGRRLCHGCFKSEQLAYRMEKVA